MKKVREGYKMTELGEIPEEWEVRQVQDLINKNIIIDVLDGNHGAIHPKSRDYVESGIPFIMANNISNGKVDLEGCKFISEGQSKTLRKGFAIAGDILLTHKGTIGETAIVPNTVKGYIVLTPQVTYYRLKKDNYKLNNLYLKFFFDSEIFQGIIKSLSSQSTRDYIGITEQKKLNILVPLFEEQEKISLILSSVDEQIENTDNLIEKTRELKKGLMQRLLSKGIGHSRFKNTEVGRIPEEWEVKKLGEIFKVSSGNFLSQKNIVEGEYPVYGGNGVTGYHNEYLFEDSKIVIGRVGAKCGCVCLSEPKSWITDNALFISEKIFEFENEFMFYLLNYLNLNQYANQNAQPVISGHKIYELKIAFPSELEQKQIASILSSVDEQTYLYKSKKIKLLELKKGLMQKLLTGEIRVKI